MGTPPVNPLEPPPPPGSPTQIPISVTAYGLADQEVDPNQAAKLAAEGYKDSGIIEHAVVAAVTWAIRQIGPLIQIAMSVFDTWLNVMAAAFIQAQGERTEAYYALVANMMGDLFGTEVDGTALWNDFQNKGRLNAMEALGAGFVNTLASEFLGVEQAAGSGGFVIAPGSGIGGLPAKDLSPAQGMDAARAFLGFVMSFAVREANTDIFAEYLSKFGGHWFKDIAEDFAKNLGLGRLVRLALRPLFNVTVGIPMTWALNSQYTPTLLNAGEAWRAELQDGFSADDLDAELKMHGYNAKRQKYLQWEYLKAPDLRELREAHIVGVLNDNDYRLWLSRAHIHPDVATIFEQVEDMRPAREAALYTARYAAERYLRGQITREQMTGQVQAVVHSVSAGTLLSDGEVQAFLNLPIIGVGVVRSHLTIARLMKDYIYGIITIGEFEDHVTALGYSADDVQILVQEMLILAKAAAEKAAIAAAKAAAKAPHPTPPGG